MAGSPVFKVYDSSGKYQAACKEPEAAAAVVSMYGNGATVRYQHGKVLWKEGTDGIAADSYDHSADVILARIGG